MRPLPTDIADLVDDAPAEAAVEVHRCLRRAKWHARAKLMKLVSVGHAAALARKPKLRGVSCA